jgi:hypothetical protein
MSRSPIPNDEPVDPDLAEQARPGYGIPSEDPRPGAQLPLPSDEAEREAKSALAGGGAIAGAATGAVVGVAAAGPVGVLVGGTVGAVAGALAGAAASSGMKPPVGAAETDQGPGAHGSAAARPAHPTD